MERAAVSAATGAMRPVLGKLTAFLGPGYTLPEGSQSDIELIISKLEAMQSLLPSIWEREDVDAPCKDWMMEARELSYDMEDAIDDFIQQRTNTSPFEDLKKRVTDVSVRFCDEWKTAETAISNSSKPVVVDPRARFLHKDASELMGMDKLKDELIELLGQGFDKRRDASRRRIGTPHHRTTQRKQMIVIKVSMPCDNSRSKAMALAAAHPGVHSIMLTGDGWDRLVVVGDGVDAVKLARALRRKMGHAEILQVETFRPAPVNAVYEQPVAACGYQQFDEVKMVCILGFAGGGKTTLAGLLYHAMREEFQCGAFVSVSRSPNMTDILRAILTEVINETYAVTEAVAEQYLIDNISNFLADKRYLIIIDDIWHWEEWEIIRKSLPKNNLGSRIIMTTRIDAIAEKCRTDDKDAFVYEIGALDSWDALTLSYRLVIESVTSNILGITEDYPCYDIVEMCYGMPLALICMSSAWVEQIQGLDGELKNLRALRRVEDGILNIPSLKPLAESLCLGYDDLPLHLRTLLLYCGVYRCRHKFERHSLVRRWIAEGFVCEEEAADCLTKKERAAEACFVELVDRGWIKQVEGSTYQIHPVMLAFLRCKSQEDNFVTCLGFCSDISSSCTRRIRRLSLQPGHSVDLSGMELSHTRSLYVFDDASTVPFKRFELLRVLELEDVEDLENDHLVDICGLQWLRYLGLKGTPISELPPQIGGLQHLETLDVRDTKVRELPWEAGQISKSVRVLAGDKHSRHGVKLPEGVCQVPKNSIPASSLAKCREVLSIIVVFDRFGLGTVPPLVGVFKVPGRHMHIPQLIKDYFKVLSSLDIRLCKLGEDDVKFLGQEMPNLQTLVVRFEVLPREPIPISGEEGFARLESFCVDSRVPRVTFGPGAMPNLKLLAFKFCAGPASEDPVGITRLQSLEKVVFRCSSRYKSDSPGISKTIGVVRREAEEHLNQITLCINDDFEENFLEKRESAHICSEHHVRRSCLIL